MRRQNKIPEHTRPGLRSGLFIFPRRWQDAADATRKHCRRSAETPNTVIVRRAGIGLISRRETPRLFSTGSFFLDLAKTPG
jgi:hypothetical protein